MRSKSFPMKWTYAYKLKVMRCIGYGIEDWVIAIVNLFIFYRIPSLLKIHHFYRSVKISEEHVSLEKSTNLHFLKMEHGEQPEN